jgi:hypothetical protein
MPIFLPPIDQDRIKTLSIPTDLSKSASKEKTIRGSILLDVVVALMILAIGLSTVFWGMGGLFNGTDQLVESMTQEQSPLIEHY